MKKIVIFGTNGVSKELRYFVESDGYEVIAYVLNREYISEETFDGKIIIPYEELGGEFSKDEITILVMTGYSKMNNNRKTILEKCRADGWDISSFIHSSVQNLAKSIGKGNIIFPHAELGLNITIGNGNIIGRHAIISHDSVTGNYNYFAGSNHVCGAVKIGNNNFFGVNSTIVDNGEIGDYNLISAGICLNKKIQDHMLIMPDSVREQTMNLRGMDLLLMRVKEKEK